MAHREFHVVGADHIDLAWKKGSGEMSELLESFVVRLLDLLDTYPAFTYVVEQAAHYRRLALRRPDLVERLGRHVRSGRVEVVGCMASTLETNLPCGEAFVRNQLLGAGWFREHFGVEPAVGWLVDTFGINAQVPQILRQFGVRFLMANRFGGEKSHDVFNAVGLDGSTLLIAGRDNMSPRIRNPRVFFRFTGNWEKTDGLFELTDAPGEGGPYLVVPYLENEYLPSVRVIENVERRSASAGASYRFSLPHEFFQALEQSGAVFPEEPGDLNPEFTGTYSQRVGIRLANRRAESLLLQAEQWAALLGSSAAEAKALVDDGWWNMAFNHFHDVFTGSHPTHVMAEVFRNYETVERKARELMQPYLSLPASASELPEGGEIELVAVNSLPWARRDIVALPCALGAGGYRVGCDGARMPAESTGGALRFVMDLPAAGVRRLRISRGGAPRTEPALLPAERATIENELIRLELDRLVGIRSLVWKPSGTALLRDAGDFLVLQRDDGNFQYEMPIASEMHAASGQIELEAAQEGPLGARAVLKGAFPGPDGSAANPAARWSLELSLPPGKQKVDVTIRVEWRGEGCRLRLKLPTTIDAAGAIHEVPFGVVRRRAYAPGFNKKGEWPAQRFVTVEDARHGLALVNTGIAGVEAAGGTVWSTLLRAPRHEYAGMVPDDTSSQHGSYAFVFALVPYQGGWERSPLLRLAQELNAPPIVAAVTAGTPSDGASHIELRGEGVVLAAVKLPEDRARGEVVLRLYEAAGRASEPSVWVKGAVEGWLSDLPETRRDRMSCTDGEFRLRLKPFEIVTLRVRK